MLNLCLSLIMSYFLFWRFDSKVRLSVSDFDKINTMVNTSLEIFTVSSTITLLHKPFLLIFLMKYYIYTYIFLQILILTNTNMLPLANSLLLKATADLTLLADVTIINRSSFSSDHSRTEEDSVEAFRVAHALICRPVV